MKFTDGLHSYNLGNHNLGIHLILRNLGDKRFPTRRYIRLIFSILESRFVFEYRFPNSI